MDNAVTFFIENYNQNINIDDYATSRGMSVSWFIRNFKKYTGSTPMQFIVGIRINTAPVSYTHLDVYKRQPFTPIL